MQPNSNKLKPYTVTAFVCTVGTILVAAAFFHQLDIKEANYRLSPLIAVEMLTLLCTLLTLAAQPFIALYYVIKKQWTAVGFVIINIILGLMFVALAMKLDPATLIYMT